MIRPGDWRRELSIPLHSIQSELNRLFEEYWRPGEAASAPPDPPRASGPSRATDVTVPPWTPTIDLWDSPTELTLVVDLPGVQPDSIDLSLAGSILTLRGTKSPLATDGAPATSTSSLKSRKGRIKERPVGSFHRQITLVDDVDFDRVEATTKDGVLTVRLPKRAGGESRTIPIQSGSA